MAMKLSEAIALVEQLMDIDGSMLDIARYGSFLRAACVTTRSYEEGGETRTVRGNGFFVIACSGEGKFVPHYASFEPKDEEGKMAVGWKWNGENFVLIEPETGG